MYRSYAVVYQNLETKRVNSATFCSRSEAEARHDFHECYRHGDYRILAVVEIPEDDEQPEAIEQPEAPEQHKRYVYTEKGAAAMAWRFPGTKAGDTYDRPVPKGTLKSYVRMGYIAEAV